MMAAIGTNKRHPAVR